MAQTVTSEPLPQDDESKRNKIKNDALLMPMPSSLIIKTNEIQTEIPSSPMGANISSTDPKSKDPYPGQELRGDLRASSFHQEQMKLVSSIDTVSSSSFRPGSLKDEIDENHEKDEVDSLSQGISDRSIVALNPSMNSITSKATPRGQEPPMYLQRPSTGRSQDVRHILARTFRDLYTRDAIQPETVKNLQVSKGGDDPYHERYVENLQKVYTEWQQRMDEAAMLERHIMQAQARAMSADERELNKTSRSCDNYTVLGLPPVRSHFKSCIDTQLLQDHSLLTPSDYAVQDPLPVPAPQGPKIPDYARDTLASRQHSRQNSRIQPETPLPPGTLGESIEFPTYISEGGCPDIQEEDEDKEDGKEIKSKGDYMRKKGWKDYLSEDQREEERRALGILQAKVNYLRNPRYVPPSASFGGKSLIKGFNRTPKEIGIQREQDVIPEESAIFVASPAVVEFNNYKVGEIYEITLELKNVSSVMRQCRVLPPSSNIFSVGLGQFPGENGLVAPGMSCKYGIRFAPDSLRDYDDSIAVETQASEPLVVKVRARRIPPVLTLPKIVDLGSCLVGGIQATQLVVKNEGGAGRFCLMARNKWPTTSIRTVIPNTSKITIKQPPFEIHPATFELHEGETTVLDILFNPQAEKVYEEEMTLACDNCHASHFTLKGEGEIAKVGLGDVELGLSEPKPGEFNDISAKSMIKFDDLNPFTYTERLVKVKNHCKVELPYQWMVYKPIMPPGNTCLGESTLHETGKEERVPDLDSVFSVYPTNGILQPMETAQFKFTFAPPTEGNFHSAIHMLLQHIPPRKEVRQQSDDSVKAADETIPVQSDDESSNMFGSVLPFKDLTGLEVEVKGVCIPLNVVLHPYAIFSPGTVLVGSSIKRLFTMANHSYSAITFQWEPYTDSYILEVEPPFGELDPGMAMDLEVSITGINPGKISHTLLCYVMNMAEPLHLHVDAEFKGPELRISQPSLNFGLVRVGAKEERTMTIINLAQMTVPFNIVDIGGSETDDPMASSDLVMSETSGELKPLERRTLTMTLEPTCPRKFKRVCQVEYEGGEPCTIGVYGEAQNPVVYFLECEKHLPEVYLKVPVIFNVVLHNQTLLPTTYKWKEVEGSQKDDCEVSLPDEIGVINSWEQKTITISFTPFKAISYSDVRIPCQVEGQKEEIYINISCDVQTLQVTYKTSTDSHLLSDDLHLNFGTDVKLSETVTRYVHICNQTAITAPFNVSVEYLKSIQPTPPVTDSDQHVPKSSHRRNILSRTPNIADPMSKAESKVKDDLNKYILGKKRGAAFVVRPSEGQLQPFGEQIIEVSGLSDMWGNYRDNLMFAVGDLKTTSIPMDMKVSGCPLIFQITAGRKDHKPVVRFGTHVSGVSPITKKLKISNTSPNDIRVDWEIFEEDNCAEKLIDFVTCFGRPFPEKDIQGNEIIPSKKAEPLLPTPSMEVIINSPDTSFMSSSVLSRLQNDSTLSTLNSDEEIPKLISCYLRSHDGNPNTKPYTISPSQVVIPGYGSNTVDLNFTPLPTSDVSQEIDCMGYALGYLSLDHEDASISQITRQEAFEADVLKLDFTAHLKPALLTVEETEEDGMVYNVAMSDILKNKKRIQESLKVCSTMLSNHTLTPLKFKLGVKNPFTLLDLDPSTSVNGSPRAQETIFCTLNPRHSMMVKVAFCVTKSLIAEKRNVDTGSPQTKHIFEDKLKIEFDNGAVQTIPLSASLAVPQIKLSVDSLDFGTCLVGQTREKELMITNETASISYWTIAAKNASENCDSGTFRISPDEGALDAYITHVSNSKTMLKVFFTAKHSEDYECTFVVQGILGEVAQRIHVAGRGSYDGKHEAFLNI